MDLRYDILKTELELVQQQIDKYDTLSIKIKTWAVTLWAASVGWALQTKRFEILLLGIPILIMLWGFDALNKTFREDYKERRRQVGEALQTFFKNKEIPHDTIAPHLPMHARIDTLHNMFRLHIAPPYVIFIIISLVFYFNFV